MRGSLENRDKLHARARSGVPACCVFLLLLCLIAPASRSSAGSESEFDAANKLYEQQRYQDAFAAYETILRKGIVSPAIYFNLGNASLKLGRPGVALLNYRRAQLLAPRDPDIRANIHFVRDGSGLALPPQANFLDRFSHSFTANELAAATFIGFWMFGTLLALGQWRPSARAAIRPYLIVTIAFSGLFGGMLASWFHSNRPGFRVILPEKGSQARYGPLHESQPAFALKEGSELLVLDRKGEWLQVTDDGKRMGWVPESTVMAVSHASPEGRKAPIELPPLPAKSSTN